MSVQKILEGAQFAKDTVDVCLRSDLDAEVRQKALELAQVMASKDDPDDSRLGRKPADPESEVERIQDEITALEEKMAAHVLTFHMQGISTGEYNILQRTAGRPRKDNKPDQSVGYNIQAFFEKAIKRCTYKVTSPDGDEATFEDEQWKMLFAAINDGQMDDLCRCVETVNRRPIRNPTKARTSEQATDSEPKLEQPTESESVTDDSPDGSQLELQQS